MTIKVKLNDERLAPLTDEQLAKLSREDLLVVLRNEYSLRNFILGFVSELEEKVFLSEGKYFRIRAKLFGKSSERSGRTGNHDNRSRGGSGGKGKSTKLPSERYPNAEIIEKHITAEEAPTCPCCSSEMQDSGMYETSEYLTVQPRKYMVVRQHRHKYRCGKCHGSIVTTPPIPRIIPGSGFSDELVIDATLSKYCDLIPMERYSQMAKRLGLPGLPPQSLIGATFKLAEFLLEAYLKTQKETLAAKILMADETLHPMLEGDDRDHWYLWAFLAEKACFFECHDTRSGDVASTVLDVSSCEALVSDVYSGYKKAIREANEIRETKGLEPIKVAYCNSHARRWFKTAEGEAPVDCEYMSERYKEIYRLNALTAGQPAETVLNFRAMMKPKFEDMKQYASERVAGYSSKSWIARGFNYFLNNYDGLTEFLSDPRIPIDNNPAERLLRSPVVGRKTWYGTHSREGARVAAIHFTLVESCKLNDVNPRAYYKDMVDRIHAKKPLLTPSEYAAGITATAPPTPLN